LLATDPDGDELTFEATTSLQGLTLNPDGTYSFDPSLNTAAQALTYKSDPLAVTANYTVTDALGATDTGTLTITVTPKPLTFSLVPSAAFVEEGSTVTYKLVASEPVQDGFTGTIQVSAGDGTAGKTQANDFGSGSLNPVNVTIAAGETESTVFTLTPTNDAATEAPESYTVTGTIDGKTYSLTGEVRDPSAVGGLGQTFTLTTGVDTIPGLVGSAGSTGTDGNDTITATNTTLTALDSLDAGLGTNVLNYLDVAGGTAIPTSLTLKNVQTVNVRSAAAATVDLTGAGISGVTTLNVTEGTSATVKAAATTAVDVSGITGTAGVKEVFTATFAGTELGGDTTILFDGVTSTLAAAAGGAALAADFVGDYNADAAANWVAVDNTDGTVTFTAKTVGAKADVVSTDFVVTANTADTAAVTVTAAAPTTQGAGSLTTVDGGASQTVSVAKGRVTVGATTVTTGDISVTNASQGLDTIAIDGGAAVTVKTTGSTGGAVTVGQGGAATDMPTGAVNVTSNHKATAATDVTLGAITVTGGTTVTVTQTADTSKAAADKTGATLTQGAVTVNAGTATTSVTVNQAKSTAEVLAVDAVAGVTESASVKFGALKSGQAIIIGGDGDITLDAGELQFTAAKDLTAEEVAQAFANLTNPDLQGGGKVANGTYSTNGNFTAWTSGAAIGDTVVFSSTATGPQTDLNAKTLPKVIETVTDPVVTPTNGVTAVPAKTGVLGVTTGAVTIQDNATAAIKTVSLDGYGTTNIGTVTNVTKLETLNLANSGGATAGATNAVATVNVGAALATLNLGLNNVQGNVTLTGAGLKTVNVTTSGANSATALSAAAAETLTIAGDKSVDLSTGTFTALKSITVSGSAGATFDGDEADTLTSINTTATTGAVTATINGDSATYTGGAGVDTLTVANAGTAITKAIDLGAGDDLLKLVGATVAVPTVTLKGGDGTDTLSIDTASAAALDNSTAFSAKLESFERLLINDAAGNNDIDLANLGFVNYVTTAGSTGTLTLSNLANNGTVVITTNPTTGYTVNVKDAAANLTDVLNVSMSANAGVLTAANVETIALTVTGARTATLTADKATTVNVGGSGSLTLDLTAASSTAVTLVDASGMTGATGLTLIADGAAAGTEVRGSNGIDTLTASGENDVLKGNGGNDIFNLTDLTSAYGGAGADVFNFAVNSNLTKVSKVYEVGAGDVFNLKDNGTIGAGAAVDKFYAAGAQYNPDTTTDVAGKVNAALVQTGEGEASWFNHGGNTYIVIDADDGLDLAAGAVDTYSAGQDIVIQIIGEFNLGTGAAFNTVTGTLEIL